MIDAPDHRLVYRLHHHILLLLVACFHAFHGRLQRVWSNDCHHLSPFELSFQQLSVVTFLVCFLHYLHQHVVLRAWQVLLLCVGGFLP